jgi:hypothetical protein
VTGIDLFCDLVARYDDQGETGATALVGFNREWKKLTSTANGSSIIRI